MDRLLAAHRRSLTFYPPSSLFRWVRCGWMLCSAVLYQISLPLWKQGMFQSPNEPALRFIFRVLWNYVVYWQKIALSTTHIWLLHHIWLLRHIWLLHHIKCDVRAILAGKTQYNFIFSLLFAISDVRMCKISCIQRMFFHSLKELLGIITKVWQECR